MLQYAFSLMWQFHGRPPVHLLEDPDAIDLSAPRVLATVDVEAWAGEHALSGAVVASERVYDPAELSGWDLYATLDLRPDRELTEAIGAAVGTGPGADERRVRLDDVRLRITTYRCLHVLMLFSADDLDGLQRLYEGWPATSRRVTAVVEALDPLFVTLEEQGHLALDTDNRFGVLTEILERGLLTARDTWLCDTHVFLSGTDREKAPVWAELVGGGSPSDPVEPESQVRANGAGVYLLGAAPVWLVDEPLTLTRTSYLVEAQSLVLAERTAYECMSMSCLAVAQAVQLDAQAAATRRRRPIRAHTGDGLDPQELRLATLRQQAIIQEVLGKRICLHHWQMTVTDLARDDNSLAEARDRGTRALDVLDSVVAQLDAQHSNRHQRKLETIILGLTLLTVYSVTADVFQFLQDDQLAPARQHLMSAETTFLVAVSLLLAVVLTATRRRT